MLGVCGPMIWRAKLYRTFGQIPNFAEVRVRPFFKQLPPILLSVLILGE